MSNLKEKLIKLGSQRPDLRQHIKPVLDSLFGRKTSALSYTRSSVEDAVQEGVYSFGEAVVTEIPSLKAEKGPVSQWYDKDKAFQRSAFEALQKKLDLLNSTKTSSSSYASDLVSEMRGNLHDYQTARKGVVSSLKDFLEAIDTRTPLGSKFVQVHNKLSQRSGNDHPMEELEELLSQFVKVRHKSADWREDPASQKQVRYILRLLEGVSIEDWISLSSAQEFHDRKPRRLPTERDFSNLTKGMAGWMIGDLKSLQGGGGGSSSSGGKRRKKRKWPYPEKYKLQLNWIRWLLKAYKKELPSNLVDDPQVDREKDVRRNNWGTKKIPKGLPFLSGVTSDNKAPFKFVLEPNGDNSQLEVTCQSPYLPLDVRAYKTKTDDKGLQGLFEYIKKCLKTLNNQITVHTLDNDIIPKFRSKMKSSFGLSYEPKIRFNRYKDPRDRYFSFRMSRSSNKLSIKTYFEFKGPTLKITVTSSVYSSGFSRTSKSSDLEFRGVPRLIKIMKDTSLEAAEDADRLEVQHAEGLVVQLGKWHDRGSERHLTKHRVYEVKGFLGTDNRIVKRKEYAARFESEEEVPIPVLTKFNKSYQINLVPDDEAAEDRSYKWRSTDYGGAGGSGDWPFGKYWTP